MNRIYPVQLCSSSEHREENINKGKKTVNIEKKKQTKRRNSRKREIEIRVVEYHKMVSLKTPQKT